MGQRAVLERDPFATESCAEECGTRRALFCPPRGSTKGSGQGAAAGNFAYANLANPVVLRAGTTYHLVSEEAEGGDAWYDYDTRMVTTGAASGTGYVYAWGFNPTSWVAGGERGDGFVPLSLLYGTS